MLITTRIERQCICCGQTTTLIDTNTAHSICSEDCIYNLWADNMYNKRGPLGEHNEYLFG
jgi:endogenous inhibitor of DNA gyrase (YacG/DUF329 family)